MGVVEFDDFECEVGEELGWVMEGVACFEGGPEFGDLERVGGEFDVDKGGPGDDS